MGSGRRGSLKDTDAVAAWTGSARAPSLPCDWPSSVPGGFTSSTSSSSRTPSRRRPARGSGSLGGPHVCTPCPCSARGFAVAQLQIEIESFKLKFNLKFQTEFQFETSDGQLRTGPVDSALRETLASNWQNSENVEFRTFLTLLEPLGIDP